jgi:hypothetical protein
VAELNPPLSLANSYFQVHLKLPISVEDFTSKYQTQNVMCTGSAVGVSESSDAATVVAVDQIKTSSSVLTWVTCTLVYI